MQRLLKMSAAAQKRRAAEQLLALRSIAAGAAIAFGGEEAGDAFRDLEAALMEMAD
jgi:hypothetical protein